MHMQMENNLSAIFITINDQPVTIFGNAFFGSNFGGDDQHMSGGLFVGCGQVKPHGKDILELASIAVKPEYRGQGIARKIIEILLERTPRPLYLMCIEHNGPMYVKFGFRSLLLDEMPRYFQRIVRLFRLSKVVHKSNEDLLVMKLE